MHSAGYQETAEGAVQGVQDQGVRAVKAGPRPLRVTAAVLLQDLQPGAAERDLPGMLAGPRARLCLRGPIVAPRRGPYQPLAGDTPTNGRRRCQRGGRAAKHRTPVWRGRHSAGGPALLRFGHPGQDRGLGAVASRRGCGPRSRVAPAGAGAIADKSGMRRAGEGSKEGLSSRSWYNRDRVDGDGNQDTHACTRQGRLVHVSVSRQASDWGCGLHIVSDRRL